MNRTQIKRLAHLAASEPEIDDRIQKFVLTRFKHAEMKVFLYFFQQELAERKVRVWSVEGLDPSMKKIVKAMFPDDKTDFEYKTDPSIGAGVIIENKDVVVDMSIRRMINKTIEHLREGL